MSPAALAVMTVVTLIATLALWARYEIRNAAICTCGDPHCEGECVWDSER